MPETFQKPASFIPKKPVSGSSSYEGKKGKRPFDLVMVLGFVVFLICLLLAGGAYLYRANAQQDLDNTKQELQAFQERFDTDVVEELRRLEVKLDTAEELLAQHRVLTPLFAALEQQTLRSVQYGSFTFGPLSDDGGYLVLLEGVTDDFESLALQSDSFASSKDILNPVFSQFQPNEAGDVEFSVAFALNHDLLSFQSLAANDNDS